MQTRRFYKVSKSKGGGWEAKKPAVGLLPPVTAGQRSSERP